MAETFKDQEFIEYVVKSIVNHPEDVKAERTIDERLTCTNDITLVNEESLAVRNEMLFLDARIAANDDRPLAALLLGQDFDNAIDFGDYRRIFRLASFENFRYAR